MVKFTIPENYDGKTYAQRARIAAYMAHFAEVLGDEERADAKRVECAELVEKARDAGEECRSASELAQLVLDETAEARRERIAREIRQRWTKPETLREVPGLRFDLRALQARIGTKAEQPRDWARLVMARAERGGNVSEYAYRKAMQALEAIGETPSNAAPRDRGTSRIAPISPFPMNETAQEAMKRRAKCPQNPSQQDIIRYGYPLGGAAAW